MIVSGAKNLDFSESNPQKQPTRQRKHSKIAGPINQNAGRPASPRTLPQGCKDYNKRNLEIFKLKSSRFSPTLIFSEDYSWPPPRKKPARSVVPETPIPIEHTDLL